jgi:Xaa-Pro aminopeptidase
MSQAAVASERADRLAAVRALMKTEGLDLYVVRGTDRFLNEYVPAAESTRVWLTGFTGSTGDALVSIDAAWMFVDGRYDQQASRELDAAHWRVETVPLGTAIEHAVAAKITLCARDRDVRVGYEPDRFPVDLFDRFSAWATATSRRVTMVPGEPSLVARARGSIDESRGEVRLVDERAVGRSMDDKIGAVAMWLRDHGADAMLVQRLDEIAYLTNLRGDELPFQATFRALALVTPTHVTLAMDGARITDAVRSARPQLRTVAEGDVAALLSNLGSKAIVAADPGGTTVAMRRGLEAAGISVINKTSPLTAMKAKKTPAELRAMREAFKKADRVVHAAQRWLVEQVVDAGARVTEADFAARVERMFRESGAVGLSFKVISACGENAAMAHHTPDASRMIRRGEMMLLDTGAYYAEGYATDLTRTFFVGGPDDLPTREMTRWFTLTLKSAIAGMTARIPRGAVGAQLDGITRAPLWAEGFEFNHGTGHGVGINVHEYPPRVASVALAPLEEGHVFSIEPGVYVPGHGGVRIENLCTVVPDAEDPARFLRVQTMTFSPLDTRLIDDALLTPAERTFLERFAQGYEA